MNLDRIEEYIPPIAGGTLVGFVVHSLGNEFATAALGGVLGFSLYRTVLFQKRCNERC